MVLHDHGHAQVLLAVRGDLPGDDVGTAAQAPGLDDGDLLFRPGGVGGLLGVRRAAAGGGVLAAAGRKTQDHEKGESQRHQFLHRVFSFF